MTELPEILFHAAPSTARKSIQRHGIDFRRSRAAAKDFRRQMLRHGWTPPPGNYFYGDEMDTMEFADRWIKGACDIWVVNPQDLSLIRDPEPVGDSWYSSGPVGTESLLGISWSSSGNPPDTFWSPPKAEISL